LGLLAGIGQGFKAGPRPWWPSSLPARTGQAQGFRLDAGGLDGLAVAVVLA